MTKYSKTEQGKLINSFRTDYATVRHFSQYEKITCAQLQNDPSKKARMLGELFAMAGMPELDFVPLKKAIALADGFLRTGILAENEITTTMEQLQHQIKPLTEVRDFYHEAGVSDPGNAKAPLIIFVPYYAHRLLQACEMIEENFDGIAKREMLSFYDRNKDLSVGQQIAALT